MTVSAPTLKMLIRGVAVAACMQLAVVSPLAGAGQAAGAAPQAVGPAAPGAAQAPGRGRGPQPLDPRVQVRMHHFADTNEDRRSSTRSAGPRSRRSHQPRSRLIGMV